MTPQADSAQTAPFAHLSAICFEADLPELVEGVFHLIKLFCTTVHPAQWSLRRLAGHWAYHLA